MTSIDTVPLDVDFGHLLTGSNYSDRSRVGGGVGDVDDEGNNDRDNGLGGGVRSITTVVGARILWIRPSTIALSSERRRRMRMIPDSGSLPSTASSYPNWDRLL